jgi:hypothetical protein
MKPQEATAKATQILDEERASPTGYEPNPRELSDSFGLTGIVELQLSTRRTELLTIRLQRPRPVTDNPRLWDFKSSNYALLSALLSRVAEDSRPTFLDTILLRMTLAPACGRNIQTAAVPSWKGLVSELPLVAEFCVRNGASQNFFRALGEAGPLPGHAILLRHLEDMIALNFTIFSDAEYQQLDLCVRNFRASAERQIGQRGNVLLATQGWPRIATPSELLQEIIEATDSILEESRRARFLYLKGSLLEGLNVEINQDKEVVQSYLRALGFTETLAQSLDEAERLYQEGGGEFSLKASMGHLRSFLENLHEDAFPVLHAKYGGTLPKGWGVGLAYLRHHQVFSGSEEKFVAGLYTLISDQAVHPLVAEREYARLFRNVVIEYALLFLRKLEKLGLKRG